MTDILLHLLHQINIYLWFWSSRKKPLLTLYNHCWRPSWHCCSAWVAPKYLDEKISWQKNISYKYYTQNILAATTSHTFFRPSFPLSTLKCSAVQITGQHILFSPSDITKPSSQCCVWNSTTVQLCIAP